MQRLTETLARRDTPDWTWEDEVLSRWTEVLNLMDNDLSDELWTGELTSDFDKLDYFDRYAAEHEKRFGETFQPMNW